MPTRNRLIDPAHIEATLSQTAPQASQPTSPLTSDQLPASLIQQMARDPATAWPGAPPAMGRLFPYHISTISGRYGAQGRAYSFSDEALRHNRDNAQLMRTECSIMECLEARQRCTALLNWHLVPEDENNANQQALAAEMTKIFHRIPRFVEMRRCLLEAVWYGRYMTAHRFGIETIGGRQRTVINKWEPRHGDKLVFRYDDGSFQYNPDQIGIRVGPAYDLEPATVADRSAIRTSASPDLLQDPTSAADHQADYLLRELQLTDNQRRKVESTQYGLAYWLDDWQRRTVAVHKHMIEDGPFDDPLAAGSIHGVGIRSRIYWTWYAMQECLHMLLTFLERSALGVEIWRFPMGNKKAETDTRAAAEQRIGNGRSIVLVPVPPGEQADLYGVQHIEPGMSGADAIKNLLIEYFGHKIKRYILGQTLTSEAAGTGLGSGVADAHKATFADIIKYDAINLQETITNDIVRPLQLFNFPKSAGIHLRFVIDTESENAEQKLSALSQAWSMGLEIRSEDLYQLIGTSRPSEGEDALQNPQIAQAKQQMKQGGGPGAPPPGGPGAGGPMPPGGPAGGGVGGMMDLAAMMSGAQQTSNAAASTASSKEEYCAGQTCHQCGEDRDDYHAVAQDQPVRYSECGAGEKGNPGFELDNTCGQNRRATHTPRKGKSSVIQPQPTPITRAPKVERHDPSSQHRPANEPPPDQDDQPITGRPNQETPTPEQPPLQPGQDIPRAPGKPQPVPRQTPPSGGPVPRQPNRQRPPNLGPTDVDPKDILPPTPKPPRTTPDPGARPPETRPLPWTKRPPRKPDGSTPKPKPRPSTPGRPKEPPAPGRRPTRPSDPSGGSREGGGGDTRRGGQGSFKTPSFGELSIKTQSELEEIRREILWTIPLELVGGDKVLDEIDALLQEKENAAERIGERWAEERRHQQQLDEQFAKAQQRAAGEKDLDALIQLVKDANKRGEREVADVYRERLKEVWEKQQQAQSKPPSEAFSALKKTDWWKRKQPSLREIKRRNTLHILRNDPTLLRIREVIAELDRQRKYEGEFDAHHPTISEAGRPDHNSFTRPMRNWLWNKGARSPRRSDDLSTFQSGTEHLYKQLAIAEREIEKHTQIGQEVTPIWDRKWAAHRGAEAWLKRFRESDPATAFVQNGVDVESQESEYRKRLLVGKELEKYELRNRLAKMVNNLRDQWFDRRYKILSEMKFRAQLTEALVDQFANEDARDLFLVISSEVLGEGVGDVTAGMARIPGRVLRSLRPGKGPSKAFKESIGKAIDDAPDMTAAEKKLLKEVVETDAELLESVVHHLRRARLEDVQPQIRPKSASSDALQDAVNRSKQPAASDAFQDAANQGAQATPPQGTRNAASQSAGKTTERASVFRIAPYAERTPNLPHSASATEILEKEWVPGSEGITLSDRTVKFSDLYKMTENLDIEFGLTREIVDGKSVYRLYSGGKNAVTMPTRGNMAHTHPSGSRLPSATDIENINKLFLDLLEENPLAPVPHRRIIWGPGPQDSTIYYPTVLR